MKKVSLWIVLVTAMIFTAVLRQGSTSPTVANGEATNAAFRDGLYLGNRAATSDEIPHVALGRWSTTSDRQSFADGYDRAYAEQTAKASPQVPGPTNTGPTNAAYRDGLYQGKLDAEQGRPIHIALGRWSRAEDRNSFDQGYRQAHETVVAARAEGLRHLPQASLLR
jgi:hypothetical protein